MSDLFFSSPVELEAGVNAKALCWSPARGKPLLAIAAAGVGVYIVNEEGRDVEKGGKPSILNKRSEPAECLAWHPTQRLLAIGWRDGTVSLWSEKDGELRDDRQTHRAPITCLQWSPKGSLLVSGDSAGCVGVWVADSGFRPTPKCQYQDTKLGQIAHILFEQLSEGSADDNEPDSTAFFWTQQEPGSDKIVVLRGDSQSKPMERCFQPQNALSALFYWAQRLSIVAVTIIGELLIYTQDTTGRWTLSPVNLLPGADAGARHFAVWAGPGLIASATDKDPVIHLSNLSTDENIPLTVPGGLHVSSLQYNAAAGVLAAGMLEGKAIVWTKTELGAGPSRPPPASGPNSGPRKPLRMTSRAGSHLQNSSPHAHSTAHLDDTWDPSPDAHVCNAPLSHVAIGPTVNGFACLGTVGQGLPYVLFKHRLQCRVRHGLTAVQTSAHSLIVQSLVDELAMPFTLTVDFSIGGLDLFEKSLLARFASELASAQPSLEKVFNSSRAELYEVSDGQFTKLTDMKGQNSHMALHRESIYRAVPSSQAAKGESRIEVCNQGGVVKQTILLDEAVGEPELLDITESHMALSTKGGFVRLWRLGGREAKPVRPTQGRRMEFPGGGRPAAILSLKLNAEGNKVAVIGSAADGRGADPRLLVYDAENDTFSAYDFSKEHRQPEAVFWDPAEPKLLSVLARKSPNPPVEFIDLPDALAVTLFATPDEGVLLQESFPLPQGGKALLGLQLPALYFSAAGAQAAQQVRVLQVVMRDFQGLGEVNEEDRKALINFSYCLCVGQLEQAYKTVRAVRSQEMWESMARMSVKSGRLEVAEVCLSNMGHARGARAAREAAKEPEVEARLAAMAIALNMYDEAARLYEKCGRYDLLSALLRSRGDFQRSVDVCMKHDRLHLKATYFAYARHLEALGEHKEAIAAYCESSTHCTEVPRMLWETGNLSLLAAFVHDRKEKELSRWLGHHYESDPDPEVRKQALDVYKEVDDTYEVVRFLCAQGPEMLGEAKKIAESTGDRAALFHVARLFENLAEPNIDEAMRLYAKAGTPVMAVRLAKANQRDKDLLRYALDCNPTVLLDTARYFEGKGMIDEAVQLYQRGKQAGRALELALSQGRPDAVGVLASQLGPDSDPRLLVECAEALRAGGSLEEAMWMFIHAKRYEQALELAVQGRIPMTDDVAEKMTPAKDGGMPPADRELVLRQIAECAETSRNFQLACKKYTEAGDKERGVKALIKTGDVKKVLFYAKNSRSPKVLGLAAEFFCTLDWRELDLAATIISFYMKADQFEKLAMFYSVCADDAVQQGDAMGALETLREAVKCIQKVQSRSGRQREIELVQHMDKVAQAAFAKAKELLAQGNAENAVARLGELLGFLPPDDSVWELRAGHIFAELVQFYASQGGVEQASELVATMVQRRIPVEQYVDGATLERLRGGGGAGVAAAPAAASWGGGASTGGDEQMMGYDRGEQAMVQRQQQQGGVVGGYHSNSGTSWSQQHGGGDGLDDDDPF